MRLHKREEEPKVLEKEEQPKVVIEKTRGGEGEEV